MITEVASILTGLLAVGVTRFPPAYAIRIVTEPYFSLVWESAVNRYNWRELLANQLKTPSQPTIEHPAAIDAPSAPSKTSIPTSTPTNNAQPFIVTSSSAQSQTIEPVSTQTPAPPTQQ